MIGTLRRARRKLGQIKRRVFETPESAAWRRAWHLAEDTPRHTPGTIRMMDYDIQYSDLMTMCPQWQDIFVKRGLDYRSLTDTPRILDCGANIGLASLYFKRHHPKARITAYEADPALAAIAAANLRANGAADVEVVNAAIWTAAGSLTFRAEGGDSGMIASLPGAVNAPTVTVASVRLRDLIERERFDLLKLDIEGAEEAVLADCADVLDRVGAILLDLHEFEPSLRRAPLVLERLSAAGFDYAVDDFVPLPWRQPITGADTPFPGKAMQWAMTVRAWHPSRP